MKIYLFGILNAASQTCLADLAAVINSSLNIIGMTGWVFLGILIVVLVMWLFRGGG